MSDGAPSLRAFGAGDGDIAHLAGRTVAFIGYGNQGRAQALNLRDSLNAASVSCELIVGTARDSSWAQAEADGFPVSNAADAARAAGILLLLVPDEELPQAFQDEIAPALQPNDAIVFASGYNRTYGELTPPPNVDVLLLAPRMIGRQLRQL